MSHPNPQPPGTPSSREYAETALSGSLPGPTTHRIFACERCSRRRQRCDRILPTCAPCRLAGSACANSEKEDTVIQVGDGGVTRRGFVTTLLFRIAALEDEAKRRGVVIDSDCTAERDPVECSEGSRQYSRGDYGSHSGPQLLVSPTRNAGCSTTAQSTMPGPDAGSYPPAADMNMNSLSLSAVAEPQSRAGEFLKRLSVPRIIAGMTQTYGGNPEATSRVDSLWDGISQYIRQPIGPSHRLYVQREEAYGFLDAYLDAVDFRFPRLAVFKVCAGMDAISADDDRLYRKTVSRNPAHIFMAYMVIAVVPLVSDSYPVSQGSFVSIHLLGKCLKVLDRVFSHEDGVDIIQCLHLLVVFSIHCSAAGSAWHLIGFAMNKCIALGYHREDRRVVSTFSESEVSQRRWAFWSCYLLDRLICAALGRPFSIDDRDITVPLPQNEQLASRPLDIKEDFHIHSVRYAVLLSAATSQESFTHFEDYFGHVHYWRNCTPSREDPSTREIYQYQTSLFHTLMLRIAILEILKPFRFPGSDSGHGCSVYYVSSPSSTTLPVSREEARTGERRRAERLNLENICGAVARSLDRNRMVGRHFLSFLTGYSAFSMALATLYCAVIDNPELSRTSPAAPTTPYDGHVKDSSLGHTRDALVDTACQKLEVAGRQFPRLHEYRRVVQKLRILVNARLPGQVPGCSAQEEDPVQGLVADTGPPYLRHLAQVIMWNLEE